MNEKTHSQWWAFDGLNVDYLLQQYDVYLENPEAVEASLVPIFKVWQGLDGMEAQELEATREGKSTTSELGQQSAIKVIKAFQYAENIRQYGHLDADIYPLEKREASSLLDMATYDLTTADLENMPSELIIDSEVNDSFTNASEAIAFLKGIYAGEWGLGFEFTHIAPEERQWFQNKVESGYVSELLNGIDKKALLEELYKTEKLEQFLAQVYAGQKRFSVEGLETSIPILNVIVKLSGESKVEDVIISMAHRGRLNALVHVLDEPYEWLLSLFEGVAYQRDEPTDYDKYNSSLDVKYHLGAETTRTYQGNEIGVYLANNPSHLEVVGSVVQGIARAKQDDRTVTGFARPDFNKALPILVHGDAAVTGQGIVNEMYNYSQTKAHTAGGTVHLIANNTIGFTAGNEDTQSTQYSSDPAKGYEIPIMHTNADKPESALVASTLAFEYRQAFHKDVMIDLIGYRRLGHNENDEPRSTNPVMYQLIDNHDTITKVYSDDLIERSEVSEEQVNEIAEQTWEAFEKAHRSLGTDKPAISDLEESIHSKMMDFPEVDTSVDAERLERINEDLLAFPEDFHVFDKLSRILNRRRGVFADQEKVDWGLAEALAFATIIENGVGIRLTGEDVERGTFSHRNLILSDSDTGRKITPMAFLSEAKASFNSYNSVLSEYSVLGFEYGYDLEAKDALVVWEAQYGDFVNTAQVVIDQFISSGRKKFGDLSGLVLLLPHGYEGAGPEHSSARVERFLQLSAENSWTIANLTKTSQLFHVLRRQAALLDDESIRPLVIFTPKSLLRNEHAASELSEFTEGQFQPIIETEGTKKEDQKVERLLIGSGHVTVELYTKLLENPDEEIALTRVEELYPFPEEALKRNIKRYKNLEEIVWVQEEPENQGPWHYVALKLQKLLPKDVELKYVGRPAMSAPAEGNGALHKATQEKVINEALNN